VYGVFGGGRLIDEFHQRAIARLQLLLPHPDPECRRNCAPVARDAERALLILERNVGYEEPRDTKTRSGRLRSRRCLGCLPVF